MSTPPDSTKNSPDSSSASATGARKPQCAVTAVGDTLDPVTSEIYEIKTSAAGAAGSLPLTSDLLLNSPSGDLFGLSQNAGMGWNPSELGRKQFLILSTQGGVRAPDGRPIALGYHTGHWEIGLLVEAAAFELRRLGVIPFAGCCSDPCD